MLLAITTKLKETSQMEKKKIISNFNASSHSWSLILMRDTTSTIFLQQITNG